MNIFRPCFHHEMKSARIWKFYGPYFPTFGLNAGKYGPEKLQIRPPFTQCMLISNRT